ncbi:MAG: hypothetical protein KAU46_04040 [Candidatus Aminicenantes bacterium]|nr:hypothetical protein [Candidatus Aminicenantes bacterium]
MKKSMTCLLVFFLLTGTALNAYAQANQAKKPEMKKEFIKLKYIKAGQVRDLLRGFQSQYGRIYINDELNVVTIQDVPEIIDKMLSLLKELDVKPVDILFTVDLILGSMNPGQEKTQDKKLASDPVIKELKRVLNYKYFKRVDTSILRVQDGRYSEQRIGGDGLDFELRLTPRHVKEEKKDTFQLGVRLRQRIEARRETAKGINRIIEGAREIDLISTTLAIKSGERTVIGVSRLDGGDKALILIISGKIVK